MMCKKGWIVRWSFADKEKCPGLVKIKQDCEKLQKE